MLDLNEYLLKLNDNKLHDNNVLKLFILFWDEISINIKDPSNKKNNFDHLLRKYQFSNAPINKKIKNNNNNQLIDNDLRIKNIFMHSVKGIEPLKKEYPQIPYGINLYKNSKVNSAIIIGNNGSGKSSIFSALEKIYTGRIGEQEIREASGNYLQSKNTNTAPFCSITTINREFSLDEPIYKQIDLISSNPDSSFISEYDIQQNSVINTDGSNNGLSDLIASQIGLTDFLNLKKYCYEINNYRRTSETSNYNKNIKRQNSINGEVKKINERIDNLKDNNIKSDESSYSLINEVNKMILKFENDLVDDFNFTPIVEHISNFSSLFAKYNLLKDTHKLNKGNFYEQGLEFLKSETDCPFCGNSKLDFNEIKVLIETEINKDKETIKLREEVIQNINKISLLSHVFVNSYTKLRNILFDDLNLNINSEGEFEVYKSTTKDFLNNNLFYEELSELLVFLDNNKKISDSEIFKKHEKVISIFSKFNINHELEILETHLHIRDEFVSNILKFLKQIASLDDKQDADFELKSLEQNISNLKIEYNDLQKNEPNLDQQKELYNNIKNDIKVLYDIIAVEIENIIKEEIAPLKSTVETTMKPFLTEDDIELEINFENELTISLVKNGSFFNPKEYFNNARYKIFCGALAIAIALASRKSSGVNLPLIMDDEFFDCDILNRIQFEIFFESILSLYKNTTPEMPLQFILFTHDELIFESAKKAVISYQLKNNVVCNDTIYARLFPSTQTNNEPESINDLRFWNLLYEFKYGEK
ncbi:MAG: hypothetical protein OCD02_23500 [Spirochaetaceae bacterium]